MRCRCGSFRPARRCITWSCLPGKGAQVVRAAGGSAQLLSKEGDLALVKLPSGEVRRFAIDCMATVGQVGNLDHENVTYGKAGRTRWHGKRPTVRGVAMNPVDHPHGGGEGRVKGNHPQDAVGFPDPGREDAAQPAHRPHDCPAPQAVRRKLERRSRSSRIEYELVR